jgi:RHS repeat-associated protein
MAKANPFRFSTKFQDDETDLLYYGYRYYNASAGRWLSRDPSAEPGFEALIHSAWKQVGLFQPGEFLEGPNLYGFVRNVPTRAIDRDGLNWYVIEISGGPCGVSHRVMVGDDGVGGYYTIDFAPNTKRTCSYRRLCGEGIYSYTHVSKGSAKDYIAGLDGIEVDESHTTTTTTGSGLNAAAKSLDGTKSTYCFPVKTCCDIDKCVFAKYWDDVQKSKIPIQ